MKKILIIAVCLAVIIAAVVYYLNHSVSINSIELSSPNNVAMNEAVKVVLDKDEAVYVRYWKEGSPGKFRTPLTRKAKEHDIRLLLLEPDAEYHFQVIIDKFVDISSKEMSFHTRKQSPWLVQKVHSARSLFQPCSISHLQCGKQRWYDHHSMSWIPFHKNISW